jgi:hypothetical protein
MHSFEWQLADSEAKWWPFGSTCTPPVVQVVFTATASGMIFLQNKLGRVKSKRAA